MSQAITLQADLTIKAEYFLSPQGGVQGGPTLLIPSGTVVTFPKANATGDFNTAMDDAAAKFIQMAGLAAFNTNRAQFEGQRVINGVSYAVTYNPDGSAVYANEGAPPVIANAEVGAVDATHLILHTDQNINSANSDYKTGWDLEYGGVSKVITSVTRDGTDKTKLTFVLATPVVNGNVVTLDYSSVTGNLKDDTGAFLQSVTDQAVVNTVA